MNKDRITKYAKWIGTIAFLMIAGSLLHVPQFVVKAAGIFSQPVSDVLVGYRVPYQSTQSSSCCSNPGFAFSAVPAGYRLVVQNISGTINPLSTPVPGVIYEGSISEFSGEQNHYFSLITTAADGSATFNMNMLAYIDPSDGQVSVNLSASPSGPIVYAVVTLTGYLENCLAYPGGVCPAIAH